MNELDSVPNERRYGQHKVTLKNERGEQLFGLEYALYPVDEPPLIEVESVGRRWYAEVWQAKGWSIS